jgi:uncharacterized cupin superfamily protein
MPKIDISALEVRRTNYLPPPLDAPCWAKTRRKLGDAAGLTQFGVNLLTLEPGGWSAQRHWHASEDEFIFVVSGEVMLVDEAGEHLLRAGDCAGFKAGDPDGHHLQNRSGADAVVLEIGARVLEGYLCHYPDVDLLGDTEGYKHKDGTPFSP